LYSVSQFACRQVVLIALIPKPALVAASLGTT